MERNADGMEHESGFREEQRKAIARRDRLYAAVGFLLGLAIVGIVWYGYPRLESQAETAAQLKNMQATIDGLDGQIKAADAKSDAAARDQQDLRGSMQKLGQRWTARIEAATRQAQQASAEAFRQAQARIDDQLHGVEARMNRLESASANATNQVADLQRELKQVRGDLAQQANELREVRQDMRDDHGVAMQMANLKNSEERNRKDVNAIMDSLEPRRVTFEVKKNQDTEVAPGISLKLTSIDPMFHRVNGWIFTMPDRRTLWLHNQSTEEPVTFYGDKDGKKREMVLTNVTKGGATGYVLLPKEEASKQVAGLRQTQ